MLSDTVRMLPAGSSVAVPESLPVNAVVLTLQSCLLAVSVSSVWAPGSPFSPSAPDSQDHLESTNHDQVLPNQYVPPPVSPNTSWRMDNQTNISITSHHHSSYISVTLLLVGG